MFRVLSMIVSHKLLLSTRTDDEKSLLQISRLISSLLSQTFWRQLLHIIPDWGVNRSIFVWYRRKACLGYESCIWQICLCGQRFRKSVRRAAAVSSRSECALPRTARPPNTRNIGSAFAIFVAILVIVLIFILVFAQTIIFVVICFGLVPSHPNLSKSSFLSLFVSFLFLLIQIKSCRNLSVCRLFLTLCVKKHCTVALCSFLI